MPAPQRTTSLPAIEFKDFTPGISDNPGVSYPSCAATRPNTYRCIANSSGALTPLPKRQSISAPHDAGAGQETGIVGLYVPPIGVIPSAGVTLPTPGTPDTSWGELFVGTEWLTGGTRFHKLHRMFGSSPSTVTTDDVLKNVSFADTATLFRPSGMEFGTLRSNRVNPTVPGHPDWISAGVPVVVAMWVQYMTEFPDDQNTSSNVPFDIFTNGFFYSFTVHQGRLVVQEQTSYGHGAGFTTFMGENLRFSGVNTVAPAAFTTDPQVFVPENPSGYSFLITMSANELFGVKATGAMYVTGDLTNPTVVTLPMVVGSAGIIQTPVATSIGVVYGSKASGVWVWPHGDTSQPLSTQMDPRFWMIPPTKVGDALDDFNGQIAQFARCDDWILVPNSFLYDINSKSWWRVDDEDLARVRLWTCAGGDKFFGSDSFYTNADDRKLYLFHRRQPANTFSWQSHPIWQSVAEVINVSDIEMVAEGHGEVTVSLMALDGSTVEHTFQLRDLGFPERFTTGFAIQGMYLQLRIVADSTNIFNPAPTVYSVTVYPYSEQPLART